MRRGVVVAENHGARIEDIAFRFLTVSQAPDFRSIARFRRRHLEAIEELYVQVLRIAHRAAASHIGRGGGGWHQAAGRRQRPQGDENINRVWPHRRARHVRLRARCVPRPSSLYCGPPLTRGRPLGKWPSARYFSTMFIRSSADS